MKIKLTAIKNPVINFTLKILSFTILAWILIHFLAVFGIFLSLAYPILWLFFPKSIPCFACRFKKEGEKCPFCKQLVNKKRIVQPKSFFCALANGAIIFLISLISFIIVLLESKVLFQLNFPPVKKSVSFNIPTKGQYLLGEIFPMEIEIDEIKQPINAIRADLNFDPQQLEIIEISTEDSFANIFVQKEINNELGYTRLTGGLANPGFSGPKGLFATIFFQAKKPGITKVDFLPSSLVLANNGTGSNVLKHFSSASYLILAEEAPRTEIEKQAALIQSQVLGEKTEETQIKFYQEGETITKNSSIFNQGKKEKRKYLFNIYRDLNSLILSFWNNILSPIGLV